MLEIVAPEPVVAAAAKPPALPRRTSTASPQVLPYQAPAGYAVASSLWREHKLIGGNRDAPFPMRCVKCNAPVEQHEVRRTTMYWQHPAYYATLLLGIWIGVIVLLCVRQKTQVTFGLCQLHRAKRRNQILIGWLVALMGVGLLVLAGLSMGSDDWRHSPLVPVAVILGIVLLLGAPIWAVITIPSITVRRINGNLVWFTGAGEEFLASLPVQR